MSGIVSAAGYVPYRRLDRTTVRAVAGQGGGSGQRAVASFDEDASTMAVAAGRLALAAAPAGTTPSLLLQATVALPYLDKSNATVVHAALRLPAGTGAWDAGPSVRAAVGALRLGLERPGTTLVTAADLRTGLPGGGEEASGGDGAAALLVSGDDGADVVATYLGGSTVSAEFLDRWRVPGATTSRTWEERFGELEYVEHGVRAWDAVDLAGLGVAQVDHLIVTGTHGRACAAVAKKIGAGAGRVVDGLDGVVGNTGAAHPALLLAAALETAGPDEVVALVVLADGADVLVFRTTPAVADAARRSARPVAQQAATGGSVAYGRYLAWRGLLTPEPPRRPEPARVSAPAAARNEAWKYGFVGAVGDDGAVQLPPPAGAADDPAHARPMADARGRVVTFTIDRLAYSQSPPVVFAVVDFDGGGRLPVELTDVDEAEVAIDLEVEMTFRRLGSADGIHNYFWKARPVRTGGEEA